MAKKGLSFRSSFRNNRVVILDALRPSDLQTARRLDEDLSAIAASLGRAGYCRRIRVASSAALFAELGNIRRDAEDGVLPIVHFEAHGDKDAGIEIGASGEMVGWDRLHESLLGINLACENNLGVVLAGCFGLYAITPVRIRDPSPFYFLFGADQDVAAGYLDQMMLRFYDRLLRTDSFDQAVKEVGQFKQFHCEVYLYEGLTRYFKKLERGQARRSSRSPEEILECWARPFLHGKDPLPYELLARFVAGEEDSGGPSDPAKPTNS